MQIPIASAIHLLHQSNHAVLASHSTQMPGFPYATAIPLVVDDRHQPLLLISALAEHTKNLLADPRASIAVTEAGQPNIQNAARMTLVGRFERCSPSPESVARYLRYLPEAEQYLQLDFMFFRMAIERARYIGGVGTMGWLDASLWATLPTLAADDEASLIATAEQALSGRIRIIGIDAFGVDYEADSFRNRHRFDSPLSGPQLREQMTALVRQLT